MRRPPCGRTGLDVLASQAFAPLRGLRVGLVTHPAAVDAELRHAAKLLAQAPDEDGVISAELDRAHLERIRRSVPSLANRQPAAYTWPAEV